MDGTIKKRNLNLIIQPLRSISILIFICLSLLSLSAQAEIINYNTIITEPTTYENTTLDLSHGNFIVRNNATLTINHCKIKGELSSTISKLIMVEKGKLIFTHNRVKIVTPSITSHPETQSLAYVIWLKEAELLLKANFFSIDEPFKAGLLITDIRMPTKHLYVGHNKAEDFHGVFYLLNSNFAIIENNVLRKNSYGNIVLIGNEGRISNNDILFSGRNLIGNGDGIDVIDSQDVLVNHNIISMPGCFGIWILASNHITLDANVITGGVTYGIRISNIDGNKTVTTILAKKVLARLDSNHIIITNNILSQNRYGLAALNVNDLSVKHNFFSQRFVNDVERKFWTNNSNLMLNVTQLVWKNNVYKEAFSQENKGDNSKTMKFVSFPETGGVIL